MNKILQATSRGQVTLPKNWRDQFNTNYFRADFDGKKLTLKPIESEKNLGNDIEATWEEYKNGEIIGGGDLMKKYGL